MKLAQSAWPTHAGIGGLRLDLTPAPPAAQVAASVWQWCRGLGGGSCPPDFPYPEVLAHFRTAGRSGASPAVVAQLSRVRRRLAHVPDRPWPLADWLPSTCDQQDGGYDSYLVAALLEGIAPDDDSSDALLLALTADLVRIEAGVLSSGEPDRPAQQRVRACAGVLAALLQLTGRPPLPDGDGRPGELADRVADLAADLPSRLTTAVTLALLPTTVLHDELMFIRVLQVFETLYRQVFDRLVRTRAAMAAGEVDAARTALAEAGARLALSPALYRVVTTMPRDAFAIIRAHTDGRSAVQSRWFRLIEQLGAPRPAPPAVDGLPEVDIDGPTVQDTFLTAARVLDQDGLLALAEPMAELDAAWRAMKRTHWGVALKIIGPVPGTGGTSGADYLRRAADVPLFPVTAVLPVGRHPVLARRYR